MKNKIKIIQSTNNAFIQERVIKYIFVSGSNLLTLNLFFCFSSLKLINSQFLYLFTSLPAEKNSFCCRGFSPVVTSSCGRADWWSASWISLESSASKTAEFLRGTMRWSVSRITDSPNNLKVSWLGINPRVWCLTGTVFCQPAEIFF